MRQLFGLFTEAHCPAFEPDVSFDISPGHLELTGPAPSQVNLGPGQAAFLDLAAAGLVRVGQRAELRPVVTVLSSAPAPSVCVATAEVYDQFTGRTWTWQPANPAQ
jgi:hypothetical protein